MIHPLSRSHAVETNPHPDPLPFRRERRTFGRTVSGSPNRDPGQVRTSSPRSERGEEQGEGRFRLHTYGYVVGPCFSAYPERGSVSRSTLIASDALDLANRWVAGKAPAGHSPALRELGERHLGSHPLIRFPAVDEAESKLARSTISLIVGG